MGVHPEEPQQDRNILGDCDKERDSFLMEGTDSEKGCNAVGYGTPSDGSPIKGLDMQGITEWLGRQVQFCDERAVKVASCSKINQH